MIINKKGAITYHTFMLIISSIGIAALFVGVLFSYSGLAEEMDIPYNFDVLSRDKGNELIENNVIITDVHCEVFQLKENCEYDLFRGEIYCQETIHECDTISDCPLKYDECIDTGVDEEYKICVETCASDNDCSFGYVCAEDYIDETNICVLGEYPTEKSMPCETFEEGVHNIEYIEERTFINITMSYIYRGILGSELHLFATAVDELDLGDLEGERIVGFKEVPKVPYDFEATSTFFLPYVDCTEETNISVGIKAPQNPNINLYYLEGEDEEDKVEGKYEINNLEFCSYPPVKEVDVYVKDVSFDVTEDKILFTAGIEGEDVGTFCPKAYVFLQAPGCDPSGYSEGEASEILIELDTDRRNTGDWHGNQKYRASFAIENDLGFNIGIKETAEVELDFSNFPEKPDSCTDELTIIRKDTGETKTRRVTNDIDEVPNGKCTVEFVVEPTFSMNEERVYFAYYGGSGSGQGSIEEYYPLYTICKDNCYLLFSEGTLTNVTTERFPPNLSLEETLCKTGIGTN